MNFYGRRGYELWINTKTEFTIGFQEHFQLPKVRADGTSGCTQEEFDHCMYSMLERKMRAGTSDNCTVPWVKNNSKICTKQSDVTKAFLIQISRYRNQKEDCNHPCHSLVIQGGSKVVNDTKKIGKTRIFFQPLVPVTKEKYLYLFGDMFADIGGYVGILLGYSVLNLVDFITMLFWRRFS